MRRPPPAVLALTPGDLGPDGDGGELRARVRAAAAGGLRGVLLRERGLPDGPLLELARALREELGSGGWLGVHDRAHVALAAGADGLHLGHGSPEPGELAPWLAGRLCVGLSAHRGDPAERWQAVDYLLYGPVRATPAKPDAPRREPVGFAGLAAAARECAVPVLGLGGLRPEDAAAVRGAGARGLACLSGILAAADPEAAARAYVRAWEAAP